MQHTAEELSKSVNANSYQLFYKFFFLYTLETSIIDTEISTKERGQEVLKKVKQKQNWAQQNW